jgi:hypothetical protein
MQLFLVIKDEGMYSCTEWDVVSICMTSAQARTTASTLAVREAMASKRNVSRDDWPYFIQEWYVDRQSGASIKVGEPMWDFRCELDPDLSSQWKAFQVEWNKNRQYSQIIDKKRAERAKLQATWNQLDTDLLAGKLTVESYLSKSCHARAAHQSEVSGLDHTPFRQGTGPDYGPDK